MSALGAPRNISPLIRFCRYAALLSGVGYGSYRFKKLSAQEKVIQDHDDKIRERIAQRKALEKEQLLQAEMNELGREAGVIQK